MIDPNIRTFIVAGISLMMSVGAGPVAMAMGDDRDDTDQTEKSFNFKDFDQIEVTGVYDLDVQVGVDRYSVRISGRASNVELATVRLANRTLYLGQRRAGAFKNKKSVDAEITLPHLNAIVVSGVVDGEIEGIDSEALRISVSGVGDLELEGKCGTLNADLSGVGDLDAKSLNCNHAKVRVSGVGDARVWASESLDAHVSGIGDLTCYGSPKKVRKNRSFFSSIKCY